MTLENVKLFKDLEVAKHLGLLDKKLEETAKLLWDVEGNKNYEFKNGSELTIWNNGIYDFCCENGLETLALR